MPTSGPAARTAVAPSDRVAVRRHAERASYDAEAVHAVLDAAAVAHVGLATERGPVVIPMAFGRQGGEMVLHGSPASRLLRGARSAEVCATVTIVDGLVLARSAMHHSMNYRSVVVLGRAEVVDDLDERRAALHALVDHIVPGRAAQVRPPSEKELRATSVLRLPLAEASVKVRTGDPRDDLEDLDLPVWAGVLPTPVVPGAPVPSADLRVEVPAPSWPSSWSA